MTQETTLHRRSALAQATDAERARYRHLVLDIAWFGVLNGSAIAFVAVYASRLGATAAQISILSALPALVNLTFALPAGRLLQQRSEAPQRLQRAVIVTGLLQRGVYLLWAALPFLFGAQGQIWALLLLSGLMSIPGTGLAIGFHALYAAAIPDEARAAVAGRRNAAYAVASLLATVGCGWLLNALPFPSGYQIVFALGFLAGMMSTWHLSRIRLDGPAARGAGLTVGLSDLAQAGQVRHWAGALQGLVPTVRQLIPLRRLLRQLRHLGSFRAVLLQVALLHAALYLAVPLFPLYTVRVLELSDSAIGVGNGLFYLALLLMSTQLEPITNLLGHRRTLAAGIIIIALYPGLLSQAENATLYYGASLVGGGAWALVFGSMGNYVLTRMPDGERPVFLAWYNIALQGGTLLGALIAPLLANSFSLSVALLLAAAARLAAGIFVWRTRR